MKSNHVYGLGNAVIDQEIQVSDDWLQQHDIEKGVMTLIDEDRFQTLKQAIKDSDISISQEACGGSAANTIVAAQSFGAQCHYSCKVSNAECGDFYLKDLAQAGVHTSSQPVDGNTGQCLVFVTPDAQRSMLTYLGVSALVGEEDLNLDAIAAYEYLYIESYLAPSPSAMNAALKAKALAKANQTKLALSFSDPNMVRFFKPEIDRLLADGVDLVFCNLDEALQWSGTNTLEDAAHALSQVATSYVITLGDEGALIHDKGITIKLAAPKVTPIDTNGAGDLFAGSYLYGITHGLSAEASANLAIQASAKLVTQYGPRLKRDQYAGLLETAQ